MSGISQDKNLTYLQEDTRLGPLPIGPPGYRAWNTRVYATRFICGVLSVR